MSDVRANCRSMWSRENRGGDKSLTEGGPLAQMWETDTEAAKQSRRESTVTYEDKMSVMVVLLRLDDFMNYPDWSTGPLFWS